MPEEQGQNHSKESDEASLAAKQREEAARQHEEAARQHEEAAQQHEEAARIYEEGTQEGAEQERGIDFSEAADEDLAGIEPDEPWPTLSDERDAPM